MKKVVIITSSLREQSNSSLLAESFKEGAESAGHEVKLISLRDNRIAPCVGCHSCQIHGECFMKDKMNDILDDIIQADVFVFASPAYYYSVSGTMKNFIDRTFAKFKSIKDKDFYYIGSSIDQSHSSIDCCVDTVKGFLVCVENVQLKGIIYGTGLGDPDDARYSDVMNESFEMGKNI